MKIRKLIPALACLLFAASASAQSPQKNVTLTIEEAIKVALDNNPTIKIAGMEIERQDWVKKETKGNYLPSLSFTSTYNYNIMKTSMEFGGQKISMTPDNIFLNELSLTAPLFAPAILKTLKMNDEQRRAAVESARGSRITLTAEVRKAYYNLLLIDQQIAVLKESEKAVGETVDKLRVSYENGLTSEYDLLTAEVQLGNIRPQIVQAEYSRNYAAQFLNMLLSFPEDIAVTTVGTLDDFEAQVSSDPLPIVADLSGNSDLRTIDIQTDILRRQYDMVKATRLPTLAAFGNVQIQGQDPVSFGGESNENFVWYKPAAVGLSLSVPIFSGRTKTMQQRQIKNAIGQMELQRGYAEEGVLLQGENAVGNLAAAKEKLVSNRKNVTAAEKAYSISQTRYDAGAGTILELNMAQLEHRQAQLSYSNSIYEYLWAYAEYDRVIGKEY